MDKDKVQKVAWYHSHPIFDVDPSMQDLVTHYQQQVEFDRQGLPFIGVIIGPYYPKQDLDNTLINVFNLK
jgi:proteasome lid subunit RPN8/RPN11|tara:strand:- start:424 stop:633 length:210 start_codon:yes stop_codon:yes gene_type:complete